MNLNTKLKNFENKELLYTATRINTKHSNRILNELNDKGLQPKIINNHIVCNDTNISIPLKYYEIQEKVKLENKSSMVVLRDINNKHFSNVDKKASFINFVSDTEFKTLAGSTIKII